MTSPDLFANLSIWKFHVGLKLFEYFWFENFGGFTHIYIIRTWIPREKTQTRTLRELEMAKAKLLLLPSHTVSNSWVRGKCLGKGSFGTVSLGVSKSDGRVFAIKSVDRATSLPAQVVALENEIRILRSLSSPYVVEYLGDDESYEQGHETALFRNLHMEYVPGGTVSELASRRSGSDVDERTIRSHTWCIVSALRYVHSRGIVHCDVKGNNVLVGPRPNHAKLADFGSAMELSGETSPTVLRGSPLWMAPEVVRGESQGPESDIWSLGCTLIEMVTGKPAWEDRGLDTLARIGFSDELPEFPVGLSETGRHFLDKCLRREASERWSCDRLLQHPFLSSVVPNMVAESSPRCVLDGANSEFEDDDDEDHCSDSDHSICSLSAKERIGKLATKSVVNWESDGWVVVRASSSDPESTSTGNRSGNVFGEGTSWEYPEWTRTERETAGTSSEYSDSRWAGFEYTKVGDGVLQCNYCESCRAGISCSRDGWQKGNLAVKRPGIIFYILYINYSILLSYSFTIFLNKLNIFISYIIYLSILTTQSSHTPSHPNRCLIHLC